MKPRVRGLAAATALALALGAGCGGETAAVLGVIGAAGGTYRVDANPCLADGSPSGCTDRLEPKPRGDGNGDQGLTLILDPGEADQTGLYEASYRVRTGGDDSLDGAACNNVSGTVTGYRLDLGSCFQGRYVNVNKVVSDDRKTVLLYGDFFASLSEGIWVDIDESSRRIKFSDDTAGCELNNGTPSGRQVSITVQSADVEAGQFSSVTAFRIGDQVWTGGEFVGRSGLRLSGAPGTLQLQRVRDTEPATACP